MQTIENVTQSFQRDVETRIQNIHQVMANKLKDVKTQIKNDSYVKSGIPSEKKKLHKKSNK